MVEMKRHQWSHSQNSSSLFLGSEIQEQLKGSSSFGKGSFLGWYVSVKRRVNRVVAHRRALYHESSWYKIQQRRRKTRRPGGKISGKAIKLRRWMEEKLEGRRGTRKNTWSTDHPSQTFARRSVWWKNSNFPYLNLEKFLCVKKRHSFFPFPFFLFSFFVWKLDFLFKFVSILLLRREISSSEGKIDRLIPFSLIRWI